MKNETIRKLVLSAMFAALCCVATMIVQIPTVAGYTNLGECMCLLAGLVLGPWYGFFAAGIGSGLADLLAGYAHYVPGTFLIKGLVALIAALLLRPLLKKGEKIPFWRLAVIELPSEVVMVLGYFGYKALILGRPIRRGVYPQQSGAGGHRHRAVRAALYRAFQGPGDPQSILEG